MAALQKGEVVVSEQFPAGLKVLVVDDSIPCLKILEKILRRCLYDVTICSQAVAALKLLRERKGFFDVVLSDVHMPDMDGYKLLELVGFEMDLPVIMMSVDGRTSAVMRGIRHGACDYLIKPIREEELKNIWQHVIRKKWNDNKGHEHSGSVDHNDNCKQGSENAEYACSADEGSEGMKSQRKRREAKEDDGELENDDPGTSKKPRVVWSVELHQQFVSAVNQLGIDKAVPKIILELMNVPGLTRENVASHLQKFRLYLKRLSGLAQHQGGTPNSFCGHAEQTSKLGSTGRFDIQALAATGQIPPETLAALHAELLGQPSASLVFPAIDQLALLQASLQSLRCLPVDHSVTYGQPLMKCPPNMLKTFSQPLLSAEDIHSGFGSWPSCGLGLVSPSSSFGGLNAHNSNILMGVLPHQHQQLQQQKQSVVAEPSRLIPVQPSYLVVPSQSPSNFQSGNSPDSVNQNCNLNRSSAIDHSLLTPHSNSNSVGVGQISNGDLKAAGVLHGYLGPASISVSMSSCPMNAVNGTSRQVDCAIPTFSATRHMPRVISNMSCMDGSYSSKSENVIDPATLKNTGFVGKGKSIPSRFAVDELESPVSNWNNGKICKDIIGNKVKQEPNLDFIENAKLGGPILQHSSQNDLMDVFSD